MRLISKCQIIIDLTIDTQDQISLNNNSVKLAYTQRVLEGSALIILINNHGNMEGALMEM